MSRISTSVIYMLLVTPFVIKADNNQIIHGNNQIKVEYYLGEKLDILAKPTDEQLRQKDNDQDVHKGQQQFEKLLESNECFNLSYSKLQKMLVEKIPKFESELGIEGKFVVDSQLFFHLGEKPMPLSAQRVKDVEIKFELRKAGHLLPEAGFTITMVSQDGCLAEGSNLEMTTFLIFSKARTTFEKVTKEKKTSSGIMGEQKNSNTNRIYSTQFEKPIKIIPASSFEKSKDQKI